jgi:lipoprotein-releasing system permease protein
MPGQPGVARLVYRLFLSLRHLRSRLVNFIAVAGVMFGVAVLIVVTSVMDGFQEKVREVLRGTLSHLTLTPNGTLPSPPLADLEGALRAADGRVKAVAPQVIHYLIHPYKRVGAGQGQGAVGYHPMEAVGIDWEREKEVSRLREYLLAAEDLENPFANRRATEYDKEKQTVLVSRAFLRTFGYLSESEAAKDRPDLSQVLGVFVEFLLPKEVDDPNNPGEKTFAANTYRLVVSGVFDAGDQQDDLRRLYLQRDFLREAAKIDPEYMELRVRIGSFDEAASVKARLAPAFPGFRVQTWEDLRADYLRAVNTEKVMLMVVLSFIVLLGGFTILATLTLTVVEKTRDIGLLKALGATTSGILTLFLGSGLLIGVLGGLLGLGLGLWFTAHVNDVRVALESVGVHVFPPDIYLFREIPTRVDVPSVAGIVLGAMAVAFLSGLPPALRAASMDPATALRHE